MKILPGRSRKAHNGVHRPSESATLLDHEAVEPKTDSVGSTAGVV